jgi:YHS domain-containing protein
MNPQPQQQERSQRPQRQQQQSTDPVCGMKVEQGQAEGGQSSFQGKTYDFCSTQCREKFDANPSEYAA